MISTETTETPSPETLIRAFRALGKLVASEYPDGYTLTEIADTWGTDPFVDLDSEDVDAIRAVEEYGNTPEVTSGGTS
jgi:hypothetical protein